MCFGKSGHVESEKLAARPAKQQPSYNHATAPAAPTAPNYNRRRVNNNAEVAASGLQAGAELFSYGGHQQHHGSTGGHTHHHYDGGGNSGGNDGGGGSGGDGGGGC